MGRKSVLLTIFVVVDVDSHHFWSFSTSYPSFSPKKGHLSHFFEEKPSDNSLESRNTLNTCCYHFSFHASIIDLYNYTQLTTPSLTLNTSCTQKTAARHKQWCRILFNINESLKTVSSTLPFSSYRDTSTLQHATPNNQTTTGL